MKQTRRLLGIGLMSMLFLLNTSMFAQNKDKTSIAGNCYVGNISNPEVVSSNGFPAHLFTTIFITFIDNKSGGLTFNITTYSINTYNSGGIGRGGLGSVLSNEQSKPIPFSYRVNNGKVYIWTEGEKEPSSESGYDMIFKVEEDGLTLVKTQTEGFNPGKLMNLGDYKVIQALSLNDAAYQQFEKEYFNELLLSKYQVGKSAGTESKSVGAESQVTDLEVEGLSESEKAALYFKNGVENFNNGVYPQAGAYFRRSYEISLNGPNPDTSALFNAALAFQRGGMYDEALANYDDLKNLGYNKVNLYSNMAACYLGKKDEAKGLEIIETGLKKFPGDPAFFFILGTFYGDESHDNYDPDKAIEYYQQTLAVDPTFYDADYNLAALYINLSNKKKVEANDITGFSKKEIERYNTLIKEAEDYLRTSLPYAENAYRAQPSDDDLRYMLKTIYIQLKMVDKAKALDAE